MKAVFWLVTMVSMQISRSRFKQSRMSMLSKHIYVSGRFVCQYTVQYTSSILRETGGILAGLWIACVASVSVQRERNSSRVREFFRIRAAQNSAKAKRLTMGGEGGERRSRLPANPSICKNAHWFSRLSSFIDVQLCHRAKITKVLPLSAYSFGGQ